MAKIFSRTYGGPVDPRAADNIPSRARVVGADHDHTDTITSPEDYAQWLTRAKLTIEIHNRDHPNDPWTIEEEREESKDEG